MSPEVEIEPRYYSMGDMMRLMCVRNRATIDRMAKDGLIPSPIKVGRSLRWSVAAVELALDRLDETASKMPKKRVKS